MASPTTVTANDGHLSARGAAFAKFLTPELESVFKVFSDAYDHRNNPQGLVNFGVAENSLLREELTEYFNHVGLQFTGAELAYNQRLTTSQKLVDALCHLFNNYADGYPQYGDWDKRKPLIPVKPEHIHVGSGAGGVLNSMAWSLCGKDEGALLSTPFYNGFVFDFSFKSEVELIRVPLPMPKPGKSPAGEEASSDEEEDWKAPGNVKHWEKAIVQAKEKGITPRVIVYCNPANPQGQILPRETTVALLKLAAKHDLHFISDEIYARSVYDTRDTPNPTQFHSVLSMDVQKEAGLDPSRVHVVTSASKDFSVNGFRQGVCISQHNRALIKSLDMQCLPTQTSTAAGNLWANWIRDTEYLEWYLDENRRRSSMAYDFVTEWLRKQQVEYVPACAGHFLLIDLTRFLKAKDDSLESRRKAEAELGTSLIKQRVFVAPGGQYEHAVPGWFRFTFTSERHAMKEGLRRVEKALGMPSVVEDMPMLDFEKDGKKPPVRSSASAAAGQQGSSERSGTAALAAAARPDSERTHASSSVSGKQSAVSTQTDEKAEPTRKPSLFKRLFCIA